MEELLRTCGKTSGEEYVSFELFARAVAFLMEDAADKVTTSSQQEGSGHAQQMPYDEQYEDDGYYAQEAQGYVQGAQGGVDMEDPYYNEYDVD